MEWWDGVFCTERGLVCVRHRVLFVHSRHNYAFHPGYRCPVCAGLAMAEIKKMWDADVDRNRKRGEYKRVKTGNMRDDKPRHRTKRSLPRIRFKKTRPRQRA